MYKIDLNCDLGESFGSYKIGLDEKIIPLITSANIACGFHAGDPIVMNNTVELCSNNGVSMGAHTGYPDLMGFGRRNIAVSPKEVYTYVTYQLGALSAFANAKGKTLSHVKPHGAMYNMASSDESLAKAIANAVFDFDKSLILLGLSGSKMIDEAQKKGLSVACEVFADRAYESDGTLRSRNKDGAMIENENEAIDRVLQMITNGTVIAYGGEIVHLSAHSVCVHGDGKKALEFVKSLNEAFCKNSIKTAPISEVIK